jgi:hypothetical protein
MIEEYKEDVKKHFKAQEFQPEQWSTVNGKVQAVTHMRDNVLSEEPPGSVLINAIYFLDKWMFPFNEGDTGMTFHTMNNQYTNVKMMTHKRKLRIAKHGDLTAVNMLYRTPGMGAWFVKNSSEAGYKHDVAYTTLDSFIHQEFVDQTLTSSQELLELNIPKFEMKESIDLLSLFKSTKEHKITDVFQIGNLQRMTNHPGESFSIFKQDCILKVDQKGTKAAAVTKAGTTRGISRKPRYYNVTFAHTFYMVIYHNETILFVAKIGSPQDLAEEGMKPSTDDVPDTRDGHVSSHFAVEEVKLQNEYKKSLVEVTVAGKKIFMEVMTKLHDGRDDEDGEDLEDGDIKDSKEVYMTTPKTEIPVRTYTVPPDLLIRVTIKFLSPVGITDEQEKKGVDFTAVYVGEKGEEPEDMVNLKFGEPYELPFPLQKEAGEDEDAWKLTYEGQTFLKLGFRL